MKPGFVSCPKCGNEIELTEAMAQPFLSKVRKEAEAEVLERQKRLRVEQAELAQKQKELEAQKETFEAEKLKQGEEYKQRLEAEKVRIRKEVEVAARAAAESKVGEQLKAKDTIIKEHEEQLSTLRKEQAGILQLRNELTQEKDKWELAKQKDLEAIRKSEREEADKRAAARFSAKARDLEGKLNDQLKDKDEIIAAREKELGGLRKDQLSIVRERNELKLDKEKWELDKEKELEAMRVKEREEADKKAEQRHSTRIEELERKLESAQKVNKELEGKLESGSAQVRGIIQQATLKDLLKDMFPNDDIQPVPGGKEGADVLQTVKNEHGQDCGKIIWESKRTQHWQGEWLSKLRKDQSDGRADIAVLATLALPKDIDSSEGWGWMENESVVVTHLNHVRPLAVTLHGDLTRRTRAQKSSENKSVKMETLYSYLASDQFKESFNYIIHTFREMEDDLDREREQAKRIWAKRKKQLEIIVGNTMKMRGDLEGILGGALLETQMRELPGPVQPGVAIEDGEETISPTPPQSS